MTIPNATTTIEMTGLMRIIPSIVSARDRELTLSVQINTCYNQPIMNSLLVKIALIAVMLHMTFGCSWHHGSGAHACQNQCDSFDCQHGNSTTVETSSCCGQDHGDHNFEFKANTPELPNAGVPCNQHDDHAACHHDHCDLATTAKYEIITIDLSTEYMGGATSDSLVAVGRGSRHRTGFNRAPNSNTYHHAPRLRTHLLLGVLVV
ncbi:MAG: hypothetical protein ACI87E_004803 [Mariniblastus sp.]|jgi:hypothetical protein